jgi:EAL domain-containing protein (putative c-di-GMP-specific phosphodiesterase class I)
MVTAVADIGKVMNIQVIAKHVENAFVMNQLKDMDIDFLQGFHVRKPCAVADCFSKLEQASKLSLQK